MKNFVIWIIAIGFVFQASIPTFGASVLLGRGAVQCAEIVHTWDNGSRNDRAIIESWILGFWSATTAYEPDSFKRVVADTHISGELLNATITTYRRNPRIDLGAAAIRLLNKMILSR